MGIANTTQQKAQTVILQSAVAEYRDWRLEGVIYFDQFGGLLEHVSDESDDVKAREC